MLSHLQHNTPLDPSDHAIDVFSPTRARRRCVFSGRTIQHRSNSTAQWTSTIASSSEGRFYGRGFALCSQPLASASSEPISIRVLAPMRSFVLYSSHFIAIEACLRIYINRRQHLLPLSNIVLVSITDSIAYPTETSPRRSNKRSVRTVDKCETRRSKPLNSVLDRRGGTLHMLSYGTRREGETPGCFSYWVMRRW